MTTASDQSTTCLVERWPTQLPQGSPPVTGNAPATVVQRQTRFCAQCRDSAIDDTVLHPLPPKLKQVADLPPGSFIK